VAAGVVVAVAVAFEMAVAATFLQGHLGWYWIGIGRGGGSCIGISAVGRRFASGICSGIGIGIGIDCGIVIGT